MAGAARRLGLEPLDGHYCLFFNRRRQLCKMVWFDVSGWCLTAEERARYENRPKAPPRPKKKKSTKGKAKPTGR